ncbi:MAG TPA: hypothetical protein VK995_02610 [Oceanipulchritudo sp.]|nr:hypothetical protein [Oceanipulchritudo sp.]
MHVRGAFLLLACLIPLANGSSLASHSLDEAMEQARAEGKYLYIAFLGEGWSMSSKRFKDSVLETDAFKSFADHALVYFPVEARRKPPLSKDEREALHAWVIQFDIMAYPTFILIAPDGQELLRHGYREMESEAYVELLRSVLPARAG